MTHDKPHPSISLRRLVQVRSSSVDKVVVDNERVVRLCNYVDVYYNNRITDGMELSEGSAKASEIRRFTLRTGDVVITKDSETAEDIGIPTLVSLNADEVVCGYHLAILRPDPRRILGSYLYWALQSKHAREAFRTAAQGVTRFGLTIDAISKISIPVPDIADQHKIAEYLDDKCGQIDDLIRTKQQQAGALLEKEAAILDGLTFKADYTHNASVIPFKWVCRVASGQVDPTEEPWSSLPLIAPNHIESNTGRILSIETAREQGADSGKYTFPAGTVVYSKIRPALAKACIVPATGLCSADMYPIIPDRRLRPEYLLMQLLSRHFTRWATMESMRVAMPKINRRSLGEFRMLVPDLDKQERSIMSWKQRRSTTETAKGNLLATISLLKERKEALIARSVSRHVRNDGSSTRVPPITHAHADRGA